MEASLLMPDKDFRPQHTKIVSSTSATTAVTGLIQGTYIFRLTVTDNAGATTSDDVQVSVAQAAQRGHWVRRHGRLVWVKY